MLFISWRKAPQDAPRDPAEVLSLRHYLGFFCRTSISVRYWVDYFCLVPQFNFRKGVWCFWISFSGLRLHALPLSSDFYHGVIKMADELIGWLHGHVDDQLIFRLTDRWIQRVWGRVFEPCEWQSGWEPNFALRLVNDLFTDNKKPTPRQSHWIKHWGCWMINWPPNICSTRAGWLADWLQ